MSSAPNIFAFDEFENSKLLLFKVLLHIWRSRDLLGEASEEPESTAAPEEKAIARTVADLNAKFGPEWYFALNKTEFFAGGGGGGGAAGGPARLVPWKVLPVVEIRYAYHLETQRRMENGERNLDSVKVIESAQFTTRSTDFQS